MAGQHELKGTLAGPAQSNRIGVDQLKALEPFITDRSFEGFCKKHGAEINTGLIDAATTKWLVEEYGVPVPATSTATVSRARKHALVVRTCKCGRKIAGNVYFKHVKACKVAVGQAMGKARLGTNRVRQHAGRFDVRIRIATPVPK